MAEIDKGNMIGIIQAFPQQVEEAQQLSKKIKVKGKYDAIVVCGMGGSGIPADILQTIVDEKQVFVAKDYYLPKNLPKKTLAVIISYSGNTEEALSCYEEARKRKLGIFAVTSGGKLEELCKKSRHPFVKIPAGLPPRAGTGYLFFGMLFVLQNSKIIKNRTKDVNEMLSLVRDLRISRQAFVIAKFMANKVPIIYSSHQLRAAAYRWKCQVNENAKQPAFYNVYSEMNHNELEGYHLIKKDFCVIQLYDEKDNRQIRKRMEICKKIMGKKVKVLDVYVKGESLLARLFYAFLLGDYSSYYLALINKEDPTPVKVIEDLKKELARPNIALKGEKKYREIKPMPFYF